MIQKIEGFLMWWEIPPENGGMLFSSAKLVSLRSLPLDEKALPRPLFTRKTINKTIKGGDVPRNEQPALTTVLWELCQLPNECL